VKFSVKSIHPNSTSLRATNCQSSWESAVGGVEYLFMGLNGEASQKQRQITDSNQNYGYTRISLKNSAAKLDQIKRSGRYRQRNTVPI
jgi:hypothetical protein